MGARRDDDPRRLEPCRRLLPPRPLPRTDELREALNRGQSVWTLPRRGRTREFIQGVESLAGAACARIRPDTTLPPLAAAAASAVHMAGTAVLDPVRARAEADAAERRGAGTLWTAGPVAWEGVSVGTVAQAEVVPVVEEEDGKTRSVRPRIAALPRPEPARASGEVPRGTQAVSTALLAAILARLEMTPAASGGVPSWLLDAIGNPQGRWAELCAREPGGPKRGAEKAQSPCAPGLWARPGGCTLAGCSRSCPVHVPYPLPRGRVWARNQTGREGKEGGAGG